MHKHLVGIEAVVVNESVSRERRKEGKGAHEGA